MFLYRYIYIYIWRNVQYAKIRKYYVANFIWYANQDVFSLHAGSDSTCLMDRSCVKPVGPCAHHFFVSGCWLWTGLICTVTGEHRWNGHGWQPCSCLQRIREKLEFHHTICTCIVYDFFFGNESGRRRVSDSEKLPRNSAVTICCGTIRVRWWHSSFMYIRVSPRRSAPKCRVETKRENGWGLVSVAIMDDTKIHRVLLVSAMLGHTNSCFSLCGCICFSIFLRIAHIGDFALLLWLAKRRPINIFCFYTCYEYVSVLFLCRKLNSYCNDWRGICLVKWQFSKFICLVDIC